ncbi:DUF7470 family protein [Halosegnis marinus]|uniref:Uncharacterized protein n=1 Tax=Halosegnis marinus TaxID=3034023 RepID=A0ABD5ZPX8_9EURY|nr:hypothetical protein [Halosegnis sp. DT85]
MDTEEVREWLGERGEQGAVALLVGLLIVASSDKRAAAGVAVVVVGLGLVAAGLVDSALEKTGMKGAF